MPYRIVVEEQEFSDYANVIDREKILVLDKKYQRDYDVCDDFSGGTGSGPARNFAWDHAVSLGAGWHWVMDDNIRHFQRLYRNRKIRVGDGTIFRCMEDFVERYENVAQCGPAYHFMTIRKKILPVFVANTRIYSCILIRNNIPYRWRGRYNEDTDLSLRILKDGWCTIQFNAFLQGKQPTLTMKGGNTDELYRGNGRVKMAQALYANHPDVVEIKRKWHRFQHEVNYKIFRANKLKLKPGLEMMDTNEYGMKIHAKNSDSRPSSVQGERPVERQAGQAGGADEG